MSEDPRDERPEDAEPETADQQEEQPQGGAAGEPGEAAPSDEPVAEQTAPEEPEPDETVPEESAPEAEGAVGPEIEGMEELTAEAAEVEAAEGEPEGAEPAAAEPEAAEPEAAEPAAAEAERRPRRDKPAAAEPEEEVIPGMHLEPDLVLEEQPREQSEFGQYAEEEDFPEGEAPAEAPAEEAPAEAAAVAHTPLDLAADARYRATGKRKSAVARVILKPGEGTYNVNGRHLDEYFPRVLLQRLARQPLEATGNQSRMDVVARIHGGGVSAQATALRHGVARALVEADPALRTELKRRGYLTRDPRVKERKKAGLKKARKRPQFSKR
jgi:small subunit ribosomal protein S9